MKRHIKYFAVILLSGGISVFSISQVHAADITPIVQDPSSITTRVNKKISISNYAPTDLVTLDSLAGGAGMYIRQVVFADLKAMMDDAALAKISLKINSAYRSFIDQQTLYNNGIVSDPKNTDIIAKPGFSEHQLGLALDFANSTQSSWLQDNAYKYGFALSYPAGKEAITGYTYEPWHWRYIGRALAAEWKQSGLVLEQFLALKPQTYIALTLTGQTVKTPDNPTVYFINSNGTKRGFIAPNTFLSYGLQWGDILTVPSDQLITFPETKVVKLQGDPTVYQFNADKTRQAIASSEAFIKLNYSWSDIVEINATELSGYLVGPIIN